MPDPEAPASIAYAGIDSQEVKAEDTAPDAPFFAVDPARTIHWWDPFASSVYKEPSRKDRKKRSLPRTRGLSNPPQTSSRRPGVRDSALYATFVYRVISAVTCYCLLLCLPLLYFSRVARVFDSARLRLQNVDQMKSMDVDLDPFRKIWEQFIKRLVKGWETMNVISALLASAVLTILQIEGVTADPVLRTTALLALTCTLISLLYGCIYIICFPSMKAMNKAAEWAKEFRKPNTNLWNSWVMLALPSIWLSWAIVFFLV